VLPDELAQLVAGGMELGDADDKVRPMYIWLHQCMASVGSPVWAHRRFAVTFQSTCFYGEIRPHVVIVVDSRKTAFLMSCCDSGWNMQRELLRGGGVRAR
jgi:hypothetical protein